MKLNFTKLNCLSIDSKIQNGDLFSKWIISILLFLLSISSYAGNLTVNATKSNGSALTGAFFQVYSGATYIGDYATGSTISLATGTSYTVFAYYDSSSTSRQTFVSSASGETFTFKTTSVKFHFSGGYLDFKTKNNWSSFGQTAGVWNTRELFSKDFNGNAMTFQTGNTAGDLRTITFSVNYDGLTSIEKTIAVMQVLSNSGVGIASATFRGGTVTANTWNVTGSTNSDGLILEARDGNLTSLIYEARVNSTTSVVGTQNPNTNSYFLFQTKLVTLRLQTCSGTFLSGGTARYGAGSTFNTFFFPGTNVTLANGESTAQFFPGTYSFEMNYQSTTETKISVTMSSDLTLVWNTVVVTLSWPNSISYGGTGDNRFFNAPSMNLLPGTYWFNFRPNTYQQLTFAGCSYTNSCSNTSSTANISICNGQSYTPPGGTAMTANGSQVSHITNAGGCDSAITTNLTVNSLPTVTADNVSGCPGSAIYLSGSPAGGTYSVANPYTGSSTTYTYTYTNSTTGCTNTSAAATITVSDNQSPTITCPSNVTVNTDNGLCTASGISLGTPITNDNCSVASVSNDAPSVFQKGITTVTWTVTDGSGNTATCSQSVTVVDAQAPSVHTKDVTIYLNSSGSASTTASAVNDGSTDNCSISGYSLSKTSFDCSNIGANTVTLTITDGSSNTSTANAVVTVVDNIAPTVHAKDVTIYLDATGAASTTTTAVNDGSTDNCSISGLSLSKTSFDCSNIGANTVTLTVTDGSSNTSTANAVVTVVDNIAPTVHAKDVTIYLDATGAASTTATAVNDGSTDNCSISGLSLSKTSFDCSNIGANTVTLTVTDGSSNTSTATATVTVVDNIAPTVSTQNVTIYLDATGAASTTTTAVNDGSTDNCSIGGLSLSKSSFDCSNIGTNTVTLTVTDGSSNTSTANATVTVVDNIAPTVHTQNVTIYLNASGTASTSATAVNDASTDNCSVSNLSLSKTSFDCSNIGGNTVTLTVTDGSSNTSTANATVTVVDNIAPTVHTQNVTIYLNASGAASTTASAVNDGSTDNCSIASYSLSKTSFDCSNIGANTVTLTVTDGSSNTSTANATVTVVDNIAPTVHTQNVTIYLNASGAASTTASAVNDGSTDNCSISGLSLSKTSFDCSNIGANTVTLTVTDGSSNTSTANATVTVVDNIAPTVHTQNVTIYLNASGTASTSATAVNDASTDNCSVSNLSLSKTSFDCSNIGGNTVTLTVTDGSSNTSTANATVTVVDNIAPTVHTQNVTIYLNASGAASTTASAVNDGSTDNCSIASYSLSKTSFDCSNIGANTVTLTVTDGSSNTSTANAVVTVVDNIAPTVHAKNVTIYLDATGAASTTASAVNDGSTDNCSIGGLSLSKTSFDCSNIGGNTVTLTVTDGSSNTSTANATVTVVDNIAPTVHTQNVTIYLNASGAASTTASAVNDGSTDNCSVSNLSLSKTSFDCSNIGGNTVTLTVTDGSSNTSTANATVTVVDNIAPTVSCPGNQVLNIISSTCAANYIIADPISDNCNSATWSYHLSGATTSGTIVVADGSSSGIVSFNKGITTVTLYGTDGFNNATSCSFTVTVNAQEINVRGNGTTIVDGDNTPGLSDFTDFGNVILTRVFNIQNTGTLTLNISGITFTGGNFADFSVGGGVPTSVPAGSSANFTVHFAPSALGPRTTTLNISSNDCNTPNYDFAIGGILLPALGTYPGTTLPAGSNGFIAPDAPPTNTSSTVAFSNTSFTGSLFVDPSTGVLTVTDAKQTGTFPVTIQAFKDGYSGTSTFSLTVPSPNCSQGILSSPTNVAVQSGPLGVAIGDFNNDGKQDVALANSLSNTVSIRLGNGSGGFSGTTNVSVGGTPYCVVVSDFNGDGKMDLATANYDVSKVSIRLGNGIGGFSGTTEVTVGSKPRFIALGDFNGDGKTDFATANYQSNDVSIRIGDGAGGFTGTTNVSMGGSTAPYHVVVGDFNNDGKQDIAVTCSNTNKLNIRLGDGNGNFTGTTAISTGTTPFYSAIGDFDNDGKQDIVVANSNSSSLSILKGNGSGGFTPLSNVSVGSMPNAVAVGDFNGDGIQDLCTANSPAAGSTSIRFGNGSGGFTGSANVGTGTNSRSIAVGDFNNDGKEDIVVANVNSNNITLLFNSSGCSNNKTATGIEQETGDGNIQFNVFPNPTKGVFNVEIKDAPEGSLRITIYNYLGMELETVLNSDFRGNAFGTFDLSDKASSYYMIKVEVNGQVMYKKIMVER